MDGEDGFEAVRPAARWAGEIAFLFAVLRVGAVAEAAATIAGHRAWVTGPWRPAILAASALESAVVLVLVRRARRVAPAVALADLASLVAMTVAVAVVSGDAHAHTWEGWPFSYATVAAFAIGVACETPSMVVVAVTALSLLYAWIEVGVLGDVTIGGGIDVLTVVVNALIGFAGRLALDRRSAQLELLWAEAVRRAQVTGREQEDHRADATIRRGAQAVLRRLADSPTLDVGFKEHIAAELEALAGLGGVLPTLPVSALIEQVEALPAAFAARGGRLEVEVAVDDTAAEAVLPDGAAAAVLGAVREAVTNAVKHAHADRISVWLGFSADGVQAQVVDTGTGFDAATVTRGLGLTGSVQDRLASVGGTARIDSAPGAGTTVSIRIPSRVAR